MLVRSELQVWRAAIIEVNPAFAPDAVLHGNAAGGLQLSGVNPAPVGRGDRRDRGIAQDSATQKKEESRKSRVSDLDS
jgi:hypothetical protein